MSRRKVGTRSSRRGAVTVRIEPRICFPVGRGGSPCRWRPIPMAAKSTCRSSGGPSWRRVRPALRRRTGSRRAGIAPGAYQRASQHIDEVPEFVDASHIAVTGPSPQSMPATHTDHERVMDAKYCTARTRPRSWGLFNCKGEPLIALLICSANASPGRCFHQIFVHSLFAPGERCSASRNQTAIRIIIKSSAPERTYVVLRSPAYGDMQADK